VIRRLLPFTALLAAHALVGSGLDQPVLRPFLALFLFVALPTALMSRQSWWPRADRSVRGLYAFGSTVLALMLVGLTVNTVLPGLGVQRPLQRAYLSAAMFALNAVLLWWPHERDPAAEPWTSRLRRLAGARFELTQTLAVASLGLAVLGAIRLNNGASGSVALVAQVCIALTVLALLVHGEERQGRDLRSLGLVAAALLLSTSLRGWHIVGHDIQPEYLAFLAANEHQRWQIEIWRNAYNACLSINVLPTVLTQATGLAGEVVFKLLLQLVFAVVPVLTYLLARRFLPRRPAMVAAVLTMAFPTFFNDMPYLVRQEIAFFFLALLLLVATAPVQGPGSVRGRRITVGFFGLGVVLSHYSTTYVLLIGLVFGLAALGVFRLARRWWPSRYQVPGPRRPLILLSPLLVVFLALASWAWSGPLTQTGGHTLDVVKSTVAVLVGKEAKAPGSSDRAYLLFGGHKETARDRLDSFVKETMDLRASVPQEWILIKHPDVADTKPTIRPSSTEPLTRAGRALASSGVDPVAINGKAKLAGAALVQILLLLGLGWMVWRRRGDRHDVPDELACLSLGAMAALGVVVLIPKLSVEYGVLRAFQQTLLVVSPVLAVGICLVARALTPRLRPLTVVIPMGLVLTFTSVLPAMVGGYPGRLALSNSGLYYDLHYLSDSEVAASDWLARLREDTGSEAPIDAKKDVAYRIVSNTLREQPVADRLFPTLLTRSTYVFVDAQMLTKKQSTVFYSGDHITYDYPMGELDRRLDLVYSSSRARIYR
jgi:uncharacterized membrane protein